MRVKSVARSIALPLLRSLAPLLPVLAGACGDSTAEQAIAAPVPFHAWATRIDTVPGDYTHVVWLVEAGDSVFIFADPAERSAWRIDLAAGTRELFGTRGDGPGEYRLPGRIVKIHPDSVALFTGPISSPFPVLSVHTGTGRTHAFRERGQSARPDDALRVLALPMLAAADTLGNVYGAPGRFVPAIDEKGNPTYPGIDSIPIVRFSLDGTEVDTLAYLPVGEPMRQPVVNGDGSRSTWIPLGPYGAHNAWHVSADGRLLLVDAGRYEVRVIGRDGRETARWEFSAPRIPVSSGGWEAHAQRAGGVSREMLQRSIERLPLPSGQRAMPVSQRLVPDMPRVLPPVAFHGELVRAIHAVGHFAFIPVNLADPPEVEYWDVLNLVTGRRVVSLSLPARHRLLHVGSLGAYVVWKDEDDVQRIVLLQLPDLGEESAARAPTDPP